MLRFGILLVLVGLVAACDYGVGIRGRVLESPDNRFPIVLRPDLQVLKPVVGAEVRELESGYFPFSTVTDEQGAFGLVALGHVVPEKWSLRIEAPGFEAVVADVEAQGSGTECVILLSRQASERSR